MISRSAPVPLYMQVKQLLLSQIQDGTFAAGQLLPTERQLEEDHGVSRITARRALDDLEAEGYVARRAGKGTVVLHPKITHTAGRLGGLEDDLIGQGFSVRSEVFAHERKEPSAYAANVLKIPQQQPVLYERRLIYANEEPLVLGTSFHDFPEHVTFAPEEVRSGFVFRLARKKYGMKFRRVDRSTEAITLSAEVATLLGTSIETPALLAELVVYGEEQRPISLVRAIYRGDRYRYQQRVDL